MSKAEDAGSIYAEIRLSLKQMEKDSIDAQKAMDALAEKFREKGKKGGELYVQGFGKGQAQLNTRLNNMVSTMQGISPKMGAIGSKMASVFSKPIFAMVPVISAAFQAMLPVIGKIISVVEFLIKVISSAAKKQKEFNDNVNLSREVSAKLKGTTVELNAAQQKSADITAKQQHNTAVMQVAFKKLGDFFQNVFLPIINAVRSVFTEIGSIVSWVADRLGIVSSEEADAAVEAQKLADVNKELSKTIDEYGVQLKNIETAERSGAKTAEESTKAKLSAMEGYIDSLIQARTEAAKLVGENSDSVKELDDTIAARIRERDILAEQVDKLNDANEIEKARLSAIEKYEQAVKKADDAKMAGLINEEERLKQIESARAQQYSDLENISTQYRNATGEAAEELEITNRLRDETGELVKINQDKEKSLLNQKKLTELMASMEDTLTEQKIEQLKVNANSAKSEGEKNRLFEEAINLENELILKQRQRAWEAIEQSDEYIAASNNEREKILENFNKITEDMKKVKEDDKNSGNWLANLLGLTDEKLGNLTKVGEAAINAFSTISESILEVNRQHAEEQMAIIDKALESTLESIEKARKAELIASGFAVENNIESLEAQLETAKRTGDEVLIYQLERRIEEQQINDEFDAKAKEAQEAAAQEKAKIEYELAKQEHAMRLINAITAGAMAVLQALQSAPPPANYILAGLVGTAAGVQISTIANNPPKMQKFANSGIVPGDKFFGDRNIAAVDSGELILNRVHQDRLADDLTANRVVTATIVVLLDGKEIGQEIFALANKGHYTLKTRAIQG
jgi:hypothetical protein